MKLQLPKNKKLGTARRVRLFQVDSPKIKEIAEATMHPEIAVTRLAVNAGLVLIAKQLGITLRPGPNEGTDGKNAA
jgi:hypothetical protein